MYEYTEIYLSIDETATVRLNEMAAKGWRLVTAVVVDSLVLFYLERMKEEAKRLIEQAEKDGFRVEGINDVYLFTKGDK